MPPLAPADSGAKAVRVRRQLQLPPLGARPGVTWNTGSHDSWSVGTRHGMRGVGGGQRCRGGGDQARISTGPHAVADSCAADTQFSYTEEECYPRLHAVGCSPKRRIQFCRSPSTLPSIPRLVEAYTYTVHTSRSLPW